jgi:AcrR family transcriptional regulator
MPPEKRVTEETIREAAFQLVRKEGIENLNARNLAKELNCSTQPIYSRYANMADLKQEVYQMAERYHSAWFENLDPDDDIFVKTGLAYIDFALKETQLFRLLFMSNSFAGQPIGAFVTGCDEDVVNRLPSVARIDSPNASAIFTDMWLYVHGIAAMLVSNQLRIERSEIEAMVTNLFKRISQQDQ